MAIEHLDPGRDLPPDERRALERYLRRRIDELGRAPAPGPGDEGFLSLGDLDRLAESVAGSP